LIHFGTMQLNFSSKDGVSNSAASATFHAHIIIISHSMLDSMHQIIVLY
jgi:hypothetical protein